MLALPAPGRPMTKLPPLRSSAANRTASGRCLPLASTLSGGQQQTPAIGRALMDRPTSLLLDKPSVGIARPLKMEIFSSIRSIRDAGTAVLLVEQDAGA